MTEYTTSSQAIRDYLSSKERTKHWVLNRAEPPDLCYSPSVAPSVFNGNDNDFVLPPASDTGSSHSLPPKMVLRYSDGRPDEAIPYGQGHGSKLRPSQPRSRSGSGTGPAPPRGPEEIRVLPTSPVDPRPPGPVRSKSLPRSAYSQIQQDHGIPPVPPLPQMHVGFSPTPQPVWNGAQDSHHGHGRHPPAIVYAPSHARSRPHYAPPAIYTHPPQMGPNGMIYSHSAPVRPSQKYVPTPYPSVVPSAHSHMSAVKEEEHRRRSKTPNGRDRSRSRTRRDLSPASSVSSFASNGSGSTYYVMPTGRQKVHVIHTPDTSAASSGHHSRSHSHHSHSQQHSPTSVRSAGGVNHSANNANNNNNNKKPFFQRIFGGFGEKRMFSGSPTSPTGESQGSTAGSTAGSSRGGGRRLHRRSKSVPPGE